MKDKKYVDNDVWRYRISLNWETDSVEKTIYTKPFPDYYELPVEKRLTMSPEEYWDWQEDLVKEKYFTKERIQEYKDYFCKLIQESENPFDIACVDTDGGYNVTEEQLFNLE